MRAPIIAFDIETSGPVPNPYSMLSLGAVALDATTLEPTGEWYERLLPLYPPVLTKPDDVWTGAEDDPVFDYETYKWWGGFHDQLKEARRDPIDPHEAMRSFVAWIREKSEGRMAVLLAKPATFDGMFVNHYAVGTGHRYEDLPWKHRVMDLASYMVGKLGCDYHRHGRFLPKIEGHNHNALEDARVLAKQAAILMKPAARNASPESPS